MYTIEIPMTESMKAFIEEQVKKGGYKTPDEYIESLFRAEQERDAEEADHEQP